jgi:probable HAF family extracellular repeat protein
MSAARVKPGLRHRLLVTVTGLLAVVAASPAALPAGAAKYARQYVAVPLGSLGGTYSWARGINNKGTVTGTASTVSGAPRAFVHAGVTMSAVGDPWIGEWSYGQAISDNGHVAGYVIDARSRERAFLVDPTGMVRDVGTLGGHWSRAHGVNAAGHVVGVAATDVGSISRAFLYRDGAMSDLGTLGGNYSVAYGINASGEVTGAAETADGSEHAFVRSGGVMNRVCVPVGAAADTTRAGTAISDSGVITGRLDVGKPPLYGPERAFAHPFATAGGACEVEDLGTLGGAYSRGLAVNNHREIVGETQTADLGIRAFVHFEGAMRDLNARVVSGLVGRVLTDAYAINDAGQIAANSCTGAAPYHCLAFRLDPVPTPSAIEYFHAAYGHYFVTTVSSEIAALDAGVPAGWVRTGQSFRTYPVDTPGTTDVCRFWSGQTYRTKSSHHYAPHGWACAVVLVNPDWVFEGDVFAVRLPDAEGGCVDGTVPLYQLYNGGQGGAPNHRYTTSADIRAEMLLAGWLPEGTGAGVVGCVPD